MRFEKWQALGNDYIVVEAVALPWPLTPGRVRRLCDPHTGIGSDGVLLLSEPDQPGYVARLRIFNPDGSEAELSGNGARRGDPVPAPARLDGRRHLLDPDRRRRDPPHDHRSRYLHRGHGPRAAALEGLPQRHRRRRRSTDRGRARMELSARLDRQPAVRDLRRRRARARGARPRRGRSADRAPRAVPQPHERVVGDGGRAGRRFAPASSSAAWGRRCPRAPAPAAPPSPTCCAVRTPPSRCASTAASSRSRWERTCTST